MPRWLVLVPIAAGVVAYAMLANPLLPIIQFQLAGSAEHASKIIAGHPSAFREALRADSVAFVPGYLLTFILAARRTGRRSIGMLAGLAAACDLLSNWALLRGLDSGIDSDFRVGQLLEVATICALIATVTLTVRHSRRVRVSQPA